MLPDTGHQTLVTHHRFGAHQTDRCLTRPEAAEFLGCSISSLERWAAQGIGPQFVKIGPRKVGYSLRELLAFIEARQVKHAAA